MKFNDSNIYPHISIRSEVIANDTTGGEEAIADGVPTVVVRGEAAVADGVPAVAGGGEVIANDTTGGVGGADAGGAALHPAALHPPLHDCGSGAHVAFCWCWCCCCCWGVAESAGISHPSPYRCCFFF